MLTQLTTSMRCVPCALHAARNCTLKIKINPKLASLAYMKRLSTCDILFAFLNFLSLVVINSSKFVPCSDTVPVMTPQTLTLSFNTACTQAATRRCQVGVVVVSHVSLNEILNNFGRIRWVFLNLQVAIALFAVDAEKDKMMLYTAVPPSVSGIDCVAWMKAGVEAIGGKGGGGKGGMAQGQGTGAGKLAECKEAATKFAQSMLP